MEGQSHLLGIDPSRVEEVCEGQDLELRRANEELQ